MGSPLIPNPANDWRAERCGHDFAPDACPYEFCGYRDTLALVRGLTGALKHSSDSPETRPVDPDSARESGVQSLYRASFTLDLENCDIDAEDLEGLISDALDGCLPVDETQPIVVTVSARNSAVQFLGQEAAGTAEAQGVQS